VVAAVWPRRVTGVAVVAVAGSLAATAAQRLWGLFPLPKWGVAEVGVLAVLTGLVVHRAPVRRAALLGGLLAVTAGVVWLRSDVTFTAVELVGGVVLWGLPCVVVAVVVGYPRYQRMARARAVVAARHAQRLELAGDLHDFVAHDVSEMIAQAQAAATVAGEDTVAGQALRRIETAGLSAMTAMDRMVHMLHAEAAAGLADLPALTERFAESSDAEVALTVPDEVPREISGGSQPHLRGTGRKPATGTCRNRRRRPKVTTRVNSGEAEQS
jgi:signal transduction histidine kinase